MGSKVTQTDEYFLRNNGGQRVLREAVALLIIESDTLEYINQLHACSMRSDAEANAKCSRQLRIVREQITTLTSLLKGEDQTLGTFLQQIACTEHWPK